MTSQLCPAGLSNRPEAIQCALCVLCVVVAVGVACAPGLVPLQRYAVLVVYSSTSIGYRILAGPFLYSCGSFPVGGSCCS